MKQRFKSTICRQAIYMIVLVLFFAANAYPRIIANRGHAVFANDAGSGGAIRSHIEAGAGYFLNSGSDYLALLNKIEMADSGGGSDYKDWAQTCAGAIANMEKASATYLNLKQILTNTPYIPEMIERLSAFDYDGYQKKNDLNPRVFAEVKAYLAAGDVRGLFDRMLDTTTKILAALANIKAVVDAGTIPGLPLLWRLNDEFVETLLFGQYAAEIFYEIT